MLYLNIKRRLPYFDLIINITFRSEITIIVGPSGAGKTTILNSIAGFTVPDSGIITLNKRVLYETGRKPISPRDRHIGYLFQDYALFPHMTVEKNISFALKNKHMTDNLNILIKQLNISNLLHKYPHEISGGEKQRVALVRALSIRPNALLLDEPLSALDDDMREECQHMLLNVYHNWNIPFIIVTHHKQEAQKLGHRIIQLNCGKIIHHKEVDKEALIN